MLDHYDLLNTLSQPLISIVTVGELRAFALRLGWGRARCDRLDFLLAHAIAVPLDFPGVGEGYARIDSYCRRLGQPVGENDTWIAATAYATGARLLTADRDFQHLDPLFVRHDWIDPELYR